MSGDEETAVVLAFHRKDPGLLGHSQQFQLGLGQNVLQMVGGVAGVGDVEHVVKAPEEGGLLADQGVGEHAE